MSKKYKKKEKKMFLVFAVVSIWVIMGFICSKLASSKSRNATIWFYLGFFLGIFAIVAILILPAKTPELSPEVKPEEDEEVGELRSKHWYYLDENKSQLGPMSFDAFKKAYLDGKLSVSNYIWNEDMKKWRKLKELSEYHEHLEIEKT